MYSSGLIFSALVFTANPFVRLGSRWRALKTTKIALLNAPTPGDYALHSWLGSSND